MNAALDVAGRDFIHSFFHLIGGMVVIMTQWGKLSVR